MTASHAADTAACPTALERLVRMRYGAPPSSFRSLGPSASFRPHLLAAPLLVVLLSPAWASAAALPDAAAIAALCRAAARRQRIDPAGPGVIVLVARPRAAGAHRRGLAQVELGVALKPEHVMRLGSITKQFAAATLLRLVDEGKARLDDPLSKFLPDLSQRRGHHAPQLLDHTSGVASYTGIPGCYMVNPVRRDPEHRRAGGRVQVAAGQTLPGSPLPLQQQRLCAGGAVIEAITGQPWHGGSAAVLPAPAGVKVIPGARSLDPRPGERLHLRPAAGGTCRPDQHDAAPRGRRWGKYRGPVAGTSAARGRPAPNPPPTPA